MEKEEIIYKGQTFIKFTHSEDYIKYWCIDGFKVKERFEFENPKPNGLERIIEIIEAEMPNGKLSYAMQVNFLNEKYGWCYPGLCDENIKEPKSYFEFKMFFFRDMLGLLKSKEFDLKNLISFLEKETNQQPTLF